MKGQWLGISFLILWGLQTGVYAFWPFPRHDPASGAADQLSPAKVLETSQMRILLSLGERSIHLPRKSGFSYRRWNEIYMKAVVLDENRDQVFGNQGWARLCLADSEGFCVYSDLLGIKDFNAGGEYYGLFWMPAALWKRIRQVKVQAVLDEHIAREEGEKLRQLEDLKKVFHAAEVPFEEWIYPLQVQGTVFRAYSQLPEREVKMADIDARIDQLKASLEGNPPSSSSNGSANLTEQETGESPAETNRQDAAVYQKSAERITNEDVEKALKELEMQRPTATESDELEAEQEAGAVENV